MEAGVALFLVGTDANEFAPDLVREPVCGGWSAVGSTRPGGDRARRGSVSELSLVVFGAASVAMVSLFP